jgi:hypothetical protein
MNFLDKKPERFVGLIVRLLGIFQKIIISRTSKYFAIF